MNEILLLFFVQFRNVKHPVLAFFMEHGLGSLETVTTVIIDMLHSCILPF